MIALVDYGAGNLRSVESAFAAIGAATARATDPRALAGAERIVLPGVGHFGALASALAVSGLDAALRERLAAGVPVLGICLGMQALYEESDEAPGLPGLGLLPGRVERLPAGVRVPHMGWSEVRPRPGSRLFEGVPAGARFYFAHGFSCPAEGATATAFHGRKFAAAVEAGNLWGVQFHPEKSGPEGLRLLERFVAR